MFVTDGIQQGILSAEAYQKLTIPVSMTVIQWVCDSCQQKKTLKKNDGHSSAVFSRSGSAQN